MNKKADHDNGSCEVVNGQVETGSELARADELLPPTLHLLPLSERPFFPPHVMPLFIDESAWLDTIKQVGETPHKMVGLVLVKPDAGEPPRHSDFHRFGTVVRVHDPNRTEGRIRFMAEGLERFEIVEWLSKEPPYLVRVDYPQPPKEDQAELQAYGQAVIDVIKELMSLNPLYSEELKVFTSRFGPQDPSPFADFAASLTSAEPHELQEVLEIVPLVKRMERVLILLQKQREVARLQAQIRERIQDTMTEQQRKFFLKEQLKEIQKELGIAKDDRSAELERFRERLRALELPEPASKRIEEEMGKLSVLELGSPE